MLLGATGTRKTASVAWVAEQLQRPMLILQPNKTLAAQFANELRQLFPDNAVEYFVSYYDYYKSQAYVPQTDTYIEKDSSIKRRSSGSATRRPTRSDPRRNIMVVSTVSYIYGSAPRRSTSTRCSASRSATSRPRLVLRRLVEIEYTRNDMSFPRGTFRARGDTLEGSRSTRSWRSGSSSSATRSSDDTPQVIGEVVTEERSCTSSAIHYDAGPQRWTAIHGIEEEPSTSSRPSSVRGRCWKPDVCGAHDVRRRDDAPGGSCSGIENTGSSTAAAPKRTQLPSTTSQGFVSSWTNPTSPSPRSADVRGRHVPQTQPGGSRFPVPSAMDNRPLKWEEILERIGQTSTCPRSGRLRARQGRSATSSSRSSGRPDSSIPR